MPAATYVSFGDTYLETSDGGTKPTTGINIGAKYIDEWGNRFLWNGNYWVRTSQPWRFDGIGNSVVTVGEHGDTASVAVLIAPSVQRYEITLKNLGPEVVYLGGSGEVADANYPLAVNETITLHTLAAIYGVTEGGTTQVAFVEGYSTIN